MSRPGRNDPCPCGSGRKYKVCCLDKDVVRLPFTPGDRTTALAALFRFAQRAELAETFMLPADVEAELMGAVYEQHYRTWPDTPLPALGGRTPRQAATVASARPKLIGLLKAMENGSARQGPAGRPAYDLGWMWDELELTRPG